MLKVILYTQVEGAEFSAFRIWEHKPPTIEELESLRVGLVARSTVLLRGIPVHAVFFIYQDLSMQRWDCINGFTGVPSGWDVSNPAVHIKNVEYFLRQCGIE